MYRSRPQSNSWRKAGRTTIAGILVIRTLGAFRRFRDRSSRRRTQKEGYPAQAPGPAVSASDYIAKAAGELVTREKLRSTLWPEDTFIAFDASLGTAINKVR